MIDLNYDLNTVVGEFDESVVTVFQQWLHDSDFDKIVFERSYIDHIRMFHGAVPRRKYFKTVKGTSHAITRFLNFLGRNGNPLLRHYSVQCTWSDINDRLTPRMMPFAELFAGDYLCFEFDGLQRPKVIVWFHERSTEESPYTEVVADTFEQFLELLTDNPIN